MSSPIFEETIKKAVDDGIVSGVVMLGRGLADDQVFNFEAGHLHNGAPLSATDTVLTLASLTKLLTAIVILQTIEKGLLPADLDADISHLVPELAAQQVWTGKWLDGEAQTQPELRPRTAAITLRRLMTHSSGVAYAHLHDGLGKVRKALTGMDALAGSTLVERFNFPLLFEPGTGWRYGGGVDWAGRAVEKATGKTLEELVESGIAARLATGTSETDTNTTLTYWPEKRGILSRVAGVSLRDPATGKAVDMGAGPGMGFNSGTDECMGGAGMHASMGEYFSVLGSLFLDDGRLLTKESTRLLFENLLEAEAKAALNKEFEDPAWAVGNWGDALGLGEFGWSLGGCVADGDSHPYRRKGATCWGGMLNLAWFVDRDAGVCGVFATQMIPPAEPKVMELLKLFEEEMYKRYAKPKA